MANNETRLNTRLLLRYDSYENWMAKKPVLLAGEVAVATIANQEGNTSLNHNSVNLPQVLIKVGDGTTAYDLLPFASALAADVHPWAKETQAQFESRVKTLVAGLNFAAAGDLDALEALVGPISNIASSYNSGYNLGPVKSTTEAIANLNIKAKTEIDKKADAEALIGKVDKIDGYSLVSDVEITRLAGVDNYNDEAVRAMIGDNAKAIDDLEKYVGTIPAGATATNIVGYVQEKTAGIATEGAMTELGNRVTAVEGDVATIKGDYLKAADIADFETKDNVKKVADDLAAYEEANDAALAGVKATAEAARTEEEVNSQIDTKIAALNLGTTYEPIGAETRAKAYADGLITDANLAQYTTEQEVKDIVDGVIAGAADSETYNSLTKLVDYIDTHGGEAADMAEAIEALEGDVKGLKEAPAAGIKATDITAWNGEIGAKALAETKLDASTFTEYSNAHAGDYTNKQIDDAIDADVTAAINAEVLRADGAYDAKGAAATAEANAIADAAGKYETKGTAQGIVDALNLAATYEPIGAESRAIAAAETKVNTLANGAVADNTAAIAAIKNEDTGILAQAKKHTNDEIAKLSAADGALTLLDKRVKANEDKLAGVTGTVLDAINAAKAGIATTAAAGLVKASEAVTVAEDGTLGIAKVSTDTLFNGANELVLFGGTANGFNN